MENREVFSSILRQGNQAQKTDEGVFQGGPLSPSTPPIEPAGKGAGWKKMRKLFLVTVLFLAVLLLASGIYFTFFPEKTILGFNLADKAWEGFVRQGLSKPAERKILVRYTDTGEFKFLPSEVGKKLDEAMPDSFFSFESIAAGLDEQLGFTLKDVLAESSVEGFWGLGEKPVFDFSLSGNSVNNSEKNELAVEVKFKDKELYLKPSFNAQLKKDYLESVGVFGVREEFLDEISDKWIKFNQNSEAVKMLEAGASGLSPIGLARENSRDAKRIADIRQLMSALELYYNDCGYGYPDGENLLVGGMNLSAPVNAYEQGCEGWGFGASNSGINYMSVVPTEPIQADGDCSEDINSYRYSAKRNVDGKNTGYELTFCLGSDVAGYGPGPMIATEAGMEALDVCPSGIVCTVENKEEVGGEDVVLQTILENRPFKLSGFRGISFSGVRPQAHYKMELDKDKLVGAFIKSVKVAMERDGFGSMGYEEDLAVLEKVLGLAVGKIEVKAWDVWIDVISHKISRMQLKTSALSASGTGNLFMQELSSGSLRDLMVGSNEKAFGNATSAKVMSDVRMLASALELQFNDFGGYQETDTNGKPKDLEGVYIDFYPADPTDYKSPCDETNSSYRYTHKGPSFPVTGLDGLTRDVYSDYEVNFCLSEALSGYAPGSYLLKPSGIFPDSGCLERAGCTPGELLEVSNLGDSSSVSDPAYYYESIYEFLEKLPFTAELEIEFVGKNYGKQKQVEFPEDFLRAEELEPYSIHDEWY